MLYKLEKYFLDNQIFNQNTPKIITNLIKTIPNNVPYKMKQMLVIHELITFVSQFRFNIRYWNKSIIPINAITFVIAESGIGKDSIVKTIRKSFNKSYNIIKHKQNKKAVELAIEKAIEAGKDVPESYHDYCEFLKPIGPMFVAPSTTEGFIQHLNNIDELGIGAGYLSTSELGAELMSNASLIDNIKLISELYDEGTKDVKMLKDTTKQSKEIVNLPVSALFMGSQDNILFDDSIKKKFRTEFTTKLSRRSFFVFIDEKIENDNYDSIQQFLEEKLNIENTAIDLQIKLSNALENFTKNIINKDIELSIPDDTRKLIILYKKYNELLAEKIDNLNSMSKLSKQHMYWKAIKLAGALSLLQNYDYIHIDTYKYAISFVESIFNDIVKFEQELNKEAYEVFVSYMHTYCNNKDFFISIHDLKKKRFINNTGNPVKKTEELVTLSSIYDKNGLYRLTEEGIIFSKLHTSDTIGVSYKKLSGTKEYRAKHCENGYTYIEGKFEKLPNILIEDMSYSPFRFINGERSNDNINSGTKWIALDIDKADVTDEELHIILEDLKHIIVRTYSNDPYKYRLLLEFDNIVDIPSNNWKRFINSIENELGLTVDNLPKSQVMFSYKNRNILTNFKGNKFTVKPHIEYAINVNTIINKQNNIKDLSDPFETFYYAYQAKLGEGSRALYRAAKHAKDLGANKQEIIDLIYNINSYWVNPMNEQRLYNTIIKQVEQWSI